MIKKYKDFSVNEAKATEDEEYDVRQICADFSFFFCHIPIFFN